MTPAMKKHLDAINLGAIDRSNIIGLRKAINTTARARAGYSVSHTSPALSYDDLDALESAIERRQPLVVGELHTSGLKLLRDKRYARKLENYQDVIANIQAFHLVRFDRIGDRELHSVPVYRASAGVGSCFYFRNIPWQSGGKGPEIVGEKFTREEF